MLPGEDRVKSVAVDLAAQTHPRGRAPAPPTRRLRASDVIVLHPAGHRGRPGHGQLGLVEVILRLTRSELPDGDHTPQAAERAVWAIEFLNLQLGCRRGSSEMPR